VVLQACASASSQWWALRAGGQLANPRSNKCLTAPAGGNGSLITVGPCNGGSRQSWILPPGPVISSISGKCLADPGNSSAAGTRVVIAGCSAAHGQKWTLTAGGRLKINGKCLAVAGSVMLNGAPVQLATCNTRAATQVWSRDSRGQLMNGQSGRCLAVPAGGTKLVQDDCTGRRGEVWAVS